VGGCQPVGQSDAVAVRQVRTPIVQGQERSAHAQPTNADGRDRWLRGQPAWTSPNGTAN
jgi:hypothetical protein